MVMATTEKTDWEKLNEVQLKGALVRRGLDSSGTKADLVKRLQEHESGSEEKAAEEENGVEDIPILIRPTMTFGYRATCGLKTVILTPFKREMLSDAGFLTWLEETSSFQIKKNRRGASAVILRFSNIDKGDAAFTDLRTKLAPLEVEVYHPNGMQNWERTPESHAPDYFASETFEEITKDTPQGNFFQRLVVLEKLPASLNNDEKLSELFPEAINVVSFQYDPSCSGIAVLEFFSVEEREEFMKNSKDEIELEGEKIQLSRYSQRSFEFKTIHDKRMNIERKGKGEQKAPDPLSDQQRINMCTEVLALEKESRSTNNSEEMFGVEKVTKLMEIKENIMKLARDTLNVDTRRRIKAGELTMPEGEDQMLHYTKNALNKAKGIDTNKDKQDKENKNQKGQPTLAKKADKAKSATKVAKQKLAKAKMQGSAAVNRRGIGKRGGRGRANISNSQSVRVGAQVGLVGAQVGQSPRGRGRGRGRGRRRGGRPGPGASPVAGGRNQQQERGRPGSRNQGNQGKRDRQKRPVGRQSSYERDQPPYKKQQMSPRGHNWHQESRGHMDYGRRGETDSSMKLIEGLTNVLTDKMRALEEMQHQTLQTQAKLLVNQSPSGGPGSFGGAGLGLGSSFPGGGSGSGSQSYGSSSNLGSGYYGSSVGQSGRSGGYNDGGYNQGYSSYSDYSSRDSGGAAAVGYDYGSSSNRGGKGGNMDRSQMYGFKGGKY